MQKVKEYFNWTETSKLKFATVVQKYNGHKKTADTFKDKWSKIHSKIMSEVMFAGLSIKEDALKNQFNRFKEAVLKDCGISEEGANLTGLPEEASTYTKLMVALAKENYDQKHAKKSQNLKKKKATHELTSLNAQGEFHARDLMHDLSDPNIVVTEQSSSPSTLSGNESEDTTITKDSNSNSSANKLRKSVIKRGLTFMDKLVEFIDKIAVVDLNMMALELRERELKLFQDTQEFNDRQEEKRRKLELDEEERRRRLDWNERSLKLQEQQMALFTWMMNNTEKN
mmetsp:Transcript_27123/g.37263  ORF Transcript_27123/g.37263 Transcript_27123/m.37263 type:complete len:284 (-) Transcript_27123:42-893(-)